MTTDHNKIIWEAQKTWDQKTQEYIKLQRQIQIHAKSESQKAIHTKMQKLIQLMQNYKITNKLQGSEEERQQPKPQRQIQYNADKQSQINLIREYIQQYYPTSTNDDINEILNTLGNLEIDENGLNGYQRFLKYKPFKYITKRGIDISPDIIPDNTTTETQKLEQIIQILTKNGTRPEEIQNTITELKDMENGYQRFLTFLKAGIQYKIQNGIEYIKNKDKQKKKEDENQTKLW